MEYVAQIEKRLLVKTKSSGRDEKDVTTNEANVKAVFRLTARLMKREKPGKGKSKSLWLCSLFLSFYPSQPLHPTLSTLPSQLFPSLQHQGTGPPAPLSPKAETPIQTGRLGKAGQKRGRTRVGRKASGDLSFFSPLSLLGSGGETDDDEPVLEIVVVEVRQAITHTH